jgi:hypothetical protein
MRLYFSTALFLWSREKRTRTVFVFNTKTTGAVALGQSQSEKRRKFWFFREKISGPVIKSGPRVGLGQQRGAAIRQKTKKAGRYFWVWSFSKTTLPPNLSFLSLFNFFLFFTIATLLLSNGRREKLLPVKVKSGSLQ